MSKIKIGFDFDRVFVDYPPFIPPQIIDFLYKKKNHHLAYRFPGELEQKLRILSHHPLLRPAIVENVIALRKLMDNNKYTTYVISSRFSFLKKRTQAWIRKHKIEGCFERMYFNFKDEEPQLFKERMIKREQIDKFIDDDLDLILYLAEKNPKVEFYWISTNRQKEELPKNAKQIKTLDEFVEKYV